MTGDSDVCQFAAHWTHATDAGRKDAALRAMRYALERCSPATGCPHLTKELSRALDEETSESVPAEQRGCVLRLCEGINRAHKRDHKGATDLFACVRKDVEQWAGEPSVGRLLAAHAARGLALALCESGDLAAALTTVDQGLTDATDLGGAMLEADLLHVRGLTLRRSGDPEASLDALKTALDAYERGGDMMGVARVQDTIGMVFMDQGNLPESQFRLQISLGHKTTTNDLPGVAMTLGNLGRVYLQLEDFERAAEFFGRDRDLAQQLADEIGQIIALHALCHAFVGLGDTTKAEEAMTAAAGLVQKHPSDRTLANHAFVRAEVLIAQGRYDEASNHHHQCAGLLREVASSYERALLQRQRGDLMAAKHDYGLARKAYDEASELAERSNRTSLLADAQYRCGTMLADQDWLADAASYLHRALTLATDLQTQRMAEEVASACARIGCQAWMESVLKLKSANASLLEAQSMQRDLAGNIVHDIRNPLMAIDGTLQIIESHASGMLDDNLVECLRRARSQCDWLNTLTSSLLDTQRMESGALEIAPQPVAVVPMVREVADWFAAEAEDCGLTLRVDAGTTDITAIGDPELIRRLVINLLKNALKYTPAGRGEIVLSIGNDPETGNVVVEVSDPGDGIPEELHAQIFTRFGQASSLRDRCSTGIGLYFCKLAAEAQGGEIGVESEMGKGSTFWFTLPAQ